MADMQFRSLGADGPQVSTIGLGCNNFGRAGTATEDQAGTTALISEAIELGVTLLDTADMYGGAPGVSESLMGVALTGRRDAVFLATKWGHDSFDMGIAHGVPKGSRPYIREALEGSLRRLHTDRIDLYQMHTPDPHTPIDETIAALDELVDEGRIIHYGHSNFSASQIDAATRAGGKFVSSQNEFSPLARGIEADVLPAIMRNRLGLLPYFPLHNGLLTGKFTRTQRPADSRIMRQRPHIAENAPWDVLEAFADFCGAKGITMLEGTFGWLLAHPALSSVIAGTTRPEQLRQNAAAATAWAPTPTEVGQMSAIFG
jgi:1-deoxyxylulose-5-phosphate synthase